jgi:phosphate transport system substrate-binding protein
MKWKMSLLLALFPFVAFSAPFTIKGSDTMVILTQRWAEAFMKKNPAVKIQVTGGGTGTGMAALLNGTTDIATASRPIKDSEKQKLLSRFKNAPVEFAVAKDGVAFYVHPKNPLKALTLEQLQNVYFGDVTDWKALGGAPAPMVVYSRENSSGTYEFVKEHLLKGEDFSPTVQTLPGTAAVVNAVSKAPNAIGFGGGAYGTNVKELSIRVGAQDISPSLENVRSGKYPLSRALFFYLRSQPSPEMKAFIEFCLSAEGQQIVSKVGYFPVN